MAVEPDSDDVASALNSLAGINQVQGKYAAAERDFREALRIAKRINDRVGTSIYTGNLGELALDRECLADAEELTREALALAEEVGGQEMIGGHCTKLALALARQGRRQEGLSYACRAVEILTKLRQPDELEKAHAALIECGG